MAFRDGLQIAMGGLKRKPGQETGSRPCANCGKPVYLHMENLALIEFGTAQPGCERCVRLRQERRGTATFVAA